MKKKNWVTIITILLVLILVIVIKSWPQEDVEENLAKCIGENSALYSQLGCSACLKQKELFGENYQYINEIDCFYEREKCSEIQYTPTWIINGEEYVGLQSIEKLKELTGC